MKDFFINLFEYENFTLYLAIIIGVLIVAFFIVFFIGRKDQKNIEKTQRLEMINNAEFNKNTTLVSTNTVENVNTPLEMTKPADNTEPPKEEPTLKSEDVFSNFNNLANSISSELDEMEKAQNKYNELIKEQIPAVEVKEEKQEEIPIQKSEPAFETTVPVEPIVIENPVIEPVTTYVTQEPILEQEPVPVNVESEPVYEELSLEPQENSYKDFVLPEAPVLPEEDHNNEITFENFDINTVNNYSPLEERKEEPVLETPIVAEEKVEEPIIVPEFEPIVFENVSNFDDEKDAIININEIDNIKQTEDKAMATNPFAEEKEEEIVSIPQQFINESVYEQEKQKTFTPSTVFSSVYAPNNVINTNNVVYDDEEEMEIELPRLK